MAAIRITDIEAAINHWRALKPSPDGVTLATLAVCAEPLNVAALNDTAVRGMLLRPMSIWWIMAY